MGAVRRVEVQMANSIKLKVRGLTHRVSPIQKAATVMAKAGA